MKLKSTIVAALMAMSFSTFAVDITLSPINTVIEIVRSAVGTTVGLVATPLASTQASTLASQEQRVQELKAIRNDAIDHVAGGEVSGNLESVLKKLRSEEALAELSDVQLSALIITSLN